MGRRSLKHIGIGCGHLSSYSIGRILKAVSTYPQFGRRPIPSVEAAPCANTCSCTCYSTLACTPSRHNTFCHLGTLLEVRNVSGPDLILCAVKQKLSSLWSVSCERHLPLKMFLICSIIGNKSRLTSHLSSTGRLSQVVVSN